MDDFAPWRSVIRSMLQERAEFRVIGEASDGLESVQKAEELQPDLILLDLGLPTLNGLEAAFRIRQCSPKSKILFLSEISFRDIIEEALRTGGDGYVVKHDAASDLLPAVEAIFQGKRFVSSSLAEHQPADPAPIARQKTRIHHRHEVEFYADDRALVDGYSRFIETALKSGSVVTLIATQPHLTSVLQKLRAGGVDADAFIDQGRYTQLDVVDALPPLMGLNHLPDPVRCAKVLGNLMMTASKSAESHQPRVAACGEFSPVLLAEGRVEAAIQLEHLTDEFARSHDIDILCGYLRSAVPQTESSHTFARICAEHSAVHRY